MTLTATEQGPVRALARVIVDGQVPQMLDISATVVDQKLELSFPDKETGRLGEGGQLGKVDFGTTLYGNEMKIEAVLTNHSPQPTPFFISSEIDRPAIESMHSSISNEMGELGFEVPRPQAGPDADMLQDGAISISPSEGMVQPYSTVPITFTFNPTQPKQAKGFASVGQTDMAKNAEGASAAIPQPYASTAVIESTETKQSITVSMSGCGTRAVS